MERLKVFIRNALAMLCIACGVVACARMHHGAPTDGSWGVDLDATRKSSLPLSSGGLPRICGPLGISFIPIMMVMEIKGDVLLVGLAGGPVEQKMQFKKVTQTEGGVLFRGGKAGSQSDEIEAIPVTDGMAKFRWRNSQSEFNDVLWKKRDTKELDNEAKDMSKAIRERFDIVSVMCKNIN